jgi:hypothetical protein
MKPIITSFKLMDRRAVTFMGWGSGVEGRDSENSLPTKGIEAGNVLVRRGRLG